MLIFGFEIRRFILILNFFFISFLHRSGTNIKKRLHFPIFKTNTFYLLKKSPKQRFINRHFFPPMKRKENFFKKIKKGFYIHLGTKIKFLYENYDCSLDYFAILSSFKIMEWKFLFFFFRFSPIRVGSDIRQSRSNPDRLRTCTYNIYRNNLF